MTFRLIANALIHWNKVHIEPQDCDDSLPLAQRRSRRLHRRLPAHYKDFIPEPPRPLPPVNAQGCLAEAEPLNPSRPSTHESAPSETLHVPSPPPHPKIKTQLNSFGLFRLYDEDSLPINDPGMATSLDEVDAPALRNNISQPLEIVANGGDPFYPYPNETSLLLGDWYWNQGHQKSQVSFRMLLDIIGHTGYDPEDVRNTNWTVID